jgi:hypothetical protein
VASNPTCADGTRLESISVYNISENGTLQTPNLSAELLTYCLDYFIDRRKGAVDEIVPKLTAMICFDNNYQKIDSQGLIIVPQHVAIVFGITMIISAICLAIAAAVSFECLFTYIFWKHLSRTSYFFLDFMAFT